LRTIDDFPQALLAITPGAVQADFARCATAPVLSIVGDESTIRAAIAEVWH